ncbi:type VI secretion system secreted protein Hcp [Sphaerotilus hippei]|uniref:Type VI secretion system secreted protein Hcp n=1 Tax=Sphaerotilus hippei TaxID=744406 RepID=A0A318HAF4_9BURK|nr:type VI secretion system tube protein Hcp [Sphaerotilus hippei]PXW97472.1 type VI secretion system secreted protein Hcp [Sphaerotilus hippei]
MDVIILEIKDVKGNCQIDKYQGQIIIQSFSHGVSLPLQMDTSNTERTAGRPIFQEMSFSKMADMSTPVLYAACVEGRKLGDAKIHIGRNENGVFMSVIEYVLTNAMVSNISTSGGGGIPGDSFSLNFTKITMDFTQQKSDSTKKGTANFGWDLETNKAA